MLRYVMSFLRYAMLTIRYVTLRYVSSVNPPLSSSTITYTVEVVNIMGSIAVPVMYNDQAKDLILQVVQENGPCLMGRDWLSR